MSPKAYRLIYASHSSTAPPSGFSRGNLGLYEGKSIGDKEPKFHHYHTSCGDDAVEIVDHRSESCQFETTGRWAVFSLKVNFDDIPSVHTKISESPVWYSSQALHPSSHVQTVVLLPLTSPHVSTNDDNRHRWWTTKFWKKLDLNSIWATEFSKIGCSLSVLVIIIMLHWG